MAKVTAPSAAVLILNDSGDLVLASPTGSVKTSNFYAGNGGTFTYAGTGSDTTKMALVASSNIAGSATGSEIAATGSFATSSANINAPSTLIDGVNVVLVAGGAAAASAGWNALSVSLNDGSATNDQAGGGAGAWVALQLARRASKNQGGTGLTPSTSFGQNWGTDVVASTVSGATNLALLHGVEINTSLVNGASAMRHAGLQISSPASHVNRGALWDNGILFALASGAATRLNGIMFGQFISGTSPLGTDSTMLAHKLAGDRTATANIGIDCNDVTFTTDFLRTNGMSVDANGVIRVGTGYISAISTGISIDAPGSIGTGTPTVSSGGSGFAVNDICDDGNKGIYRVATISGSAIATVAVIRQPVANSGSPPSTLTLTARAPSGGTGATLTGSWDSTRVGVSINPTGQKVGFNGTAPVSKPTVSGSKGSNAALTSLISALAGYGLITDTTT